MLQTRKVFLQCWIPGSDRNQVRNHSNGARRDWQAICLSAYRKQGCSMPCKHLQEWTARFEPHAAEGPNTFSVTLIKIRRKKIATEISRKNTFSTHTHTEFPQSKSVHLSQRELLILSAYFHPICFMPSLSNTTRETDQTHSIHTTLPTVSASQLYS